MGTYTTDINNLTAEDIALMEDLVRRYHHREEHREPQDPGDLVFDIEAPMVQHAENMTDDLLISHRQMTSLTGRTPGQVDNNIRKHAGFASRAFSRHPDISAKWVIRPELKAVLPDEIISLLKNGECLKQPIFVSTRSLGYLLKPAVQCGAIKKFNPTWSSQLKGATRMSFHDEEKNRTYNVFMIAPWEKNNVNAWRAIGHVWSERKK